MTAAAGLLFQNFPKSALEQRLHSLSRRSPKGNENSTDVTEYTVNRNIEIVS